MAVPPLSIPDRHDDCQQRLSETADGGRTGASSPVAIFRPAGGMTGSDAADAWQRASPALGDRDGLHATSPPTSTLPP